QAIAAEKVTGKKNRPQQMVNPMIALMDMRNVLVVTSLGKRNMRIMTTSGKCTWIALTGKLASTQARVRRKVACHRPGYGLSSSRRNSRSRFVRAEATEKVAALAIRSIKETRRPSASRRDP